MEMLGKLAAQERLFFPRHAIFKAVIGAIFLYNYQFYESCFESRRV